MSEPKNHHFVPQFYLRRFGYSDDRIFVFDKPNMRSFPQSIRRVASSKWFYAVEPGSAPDGTDRNFVERRLSAMEGVFARAVDDAIGAAVDGRPFSPDTRETMAYFMAVQALRTPEFRESLRQIDTLMNHLLSDRFGGAPPWPLTEESDEKSQHTSMLLDPQMVTTIAATLDHHIWFIGRNQTDVPLYTSDHPVVKREHVREEFRSNAGYGSPGIEVALPLTPSHVLVLVERTVHRHAGLLEHRVLDLSPQSVLYYNAMQVEQCTRQVFANAEAFDTAKLVCSERPDIRDPARVRVQAGIGGEYADVRSIRDAMSEGHAGDAE